MRYDAFLDHSLVVWTSSLATYIDKLQLDGEKLIARSGRVDLGARLRAQQLHAHYARVACRREGPRPVCGEASRQIDVLSRRLDRIAHDERLHRLLEPRFDAGERGQR